MDIAIFGAGCFWGVQLEFSKLNGVLKTEVGYQGGETKDPTYEQVCQDSTNHAEVIRIEFDSSLISYEELLNTFFSLHNPTELNRQGPDIGTQYRSVIFFQSDLQKELALKKINDLTHEKRFPHPIVTQVLPNCPFYKAEEYHQNYLAKKGMNSCKL